MKSFQITEEQVVRIVAALTADELARRYGRYVETLTQSSWGADTPIGAGGAEVGPDQARASAARAAIFFGLPEESLTVGPEDRFGDWARQLTALVRRELVSFRFHPATHGGAADTRHAADDIWQDAAAVASLIQGRRRALSLIAPSSLLGLVSGILAPDLLRVEVIDARRLTPDELAEELRFGDAVIATPTLWRYLADTLPSVPNNVVGLSYGEALNADLANRLRGRGLGALRELYGSTETGVMAWRDSPPDPFVLFDHWRRDGSTVVRERPNGSELPMVPMDDFEWQSDRTFVLGKRRDGAVQIGGINVFPKKIGEIIAAHDDVSACTVRLSQRPNALDRLIAHIVLPSGRRATQDLAWSIDEWCRSRLQPPERPRIYTFEEASEDDPGAAA